MFFTRKKKSKTIVPQVRIPTPEEVAFIKKQKDQHFAQNTLNNYLHTFHKTYVESIIARISNDLYTKGWSQLQLYTGGATGEDWDRRDTQETSYARNWIYLPKETLRKAWQPLIDKGWYVCLSKYTEDDFRSTFTYTLKVNNQKPASFETDIGYDYY